MPCRWCATAGRTTLRIVRRSACSRSSCWTFPRGCWQIDWRCTRASPSSSRRRTATRRAIRVSSTGPRGPTCVWPCRTAPCSLAATPIRSDPRPCPPYSYVYTRSRHPLVSVPPACERVDGRRPQSPSLIGPNVLGPLATRTDFFHVRTPLNSPRVNCQTDFHALVFADYVDIRCSHLQAIDVSGNLCYFVCEIFAQDFIHCT